MTLAAFLQTIIPGDGPTVTAPVAIVLSTLSGAAAFVVGSMRAARATGKKEGAAAELKESATLQHRETRETIIREVDRLLADLRDHRTDFRQHVQQDDVQFRDVNQRLGAIAEPVQRLVTRWELQDRDELDAARRELKERPLRERGT